MPSGSSQVVPPYSRQHSSSGKITTLLNNSSHCCLDDLEDHSPLKKNTPKRPPHCWLDGVEALCLMSARQRNPQLLFWSVFFGYCLLPVIRHSVRTHDPLHLPTLVLLANFPVRTKLIFPRIAVLPVEILCFSQPPSVVMFLCTTRGASRGADARLGTAYARNYRGCIRIGK